MKKIVLALTVCLMAAAAMAQQNSKQATEAARKHRAEQTTSGKSAAKPAASGSVAAQLSACKKDAELNIIKREQCVWNLCKGRWGRDGCPEETKKPTAGSAS
jgi:Flp pilus assembly protein TadB